MSRLFPFARSSGRRNLEVGGICHGAVGIFRRQADIDDDRVQRVLWIDLADDLPADAFIGSDRTEALAAEGRLLGLGDHHLGDTRLHGRRIEENHAGQ